MIWATRSGCHVDRASCAWLIRRFIDPQATFLFVEETEDVPGTAIAFDIPGAELSHHGQNCTFETMLERYALTDPALQDVGRIVHEADLADERYDAPEAAGLDVIIRGMSMVSSDDEMLDASVRVFDGLYEYRRRANELGVLPS
jgi:hypothetical protein